MFLVALGIMGYLVYREREVLLTYPWQFRPIPLVLSFVLFSLDLLVVALIWGWIMNTLSKKIGYREHFRYFTVANVAKRIPGTIWYIASRAQLYHQEGIDYKLTSLASGMELAISVMSSVLVSLLFGISIILHYSVSPIVLGIAFLLAALLLHPRVINQFFTWLKVEATPFSYKDIVLWVLAYLFAWILGGILLFVIGNIITPISTQHMGYFIGSYGLVSLLTTTLFFSPSNLGISELGLSLLLTNIMPSSVAVVLALLARLLIILYEFIWAGLCILFRLSNRHQQSKEG